MKDGECPRCGEETWRDEVHVGVGVIHGPYGCPACGWSEDERYCRGEDGLSPANAEREDGWGYDQWGGLHPPTRKMKQ